MRRMSGDTRDLGTGNELDGISTPSVLRDAGVAKVDPSVVLVEHDVFQNGAKTKGPIDLRFRFELQVDRFGVAAAFDIENARLGPNVLVITDELPVGVG